MMRGSAVGELIGASLPAWAVACSIAMRARVTEDFNRFSLHKGEAFLGDYRTMGMTQQEYRTAKAKLAKWGFATFRTTNRGTIGKLTDTRLFDVSPVSANEQNNNQATTRQQPSNNQLTTNNNDNNGIERIEGSEGKTERAHSLRAPVRTPRIIPDVCEVAGEFKRLGVTDYFVEAQKFHSHYASIGWMKGKSPITNWVPLVSLWVKREKEYLEG
jgi:hypothetical protein